MTISAAVAWLITLFSKVFKDIVPKASGCSAISFHNLKSFGIPLSDQFNIFIWNTCKILVIQQELIYHYILCREQQDTLRWFAVPSRTTGFLIVVLHALWHVVMNNKPNIRFIDTHAKCIRSYDHR